MNHPRALAKMGVWAGGGLLTGLVLGDLTRLDPRAGLAGASLVVGATVTWAVRIVRVTMVRRPCMFCGSRDAVMLSTDPDELFQPWWWWPTRSGTCWVCEEHVETWLRLKAHTTTGP